MSKFKRGPRIDAAAEAKKEQMFGDKSKSHSSQRRSRFRSCGYIVGLLCIWTFLADFVLQKQIVAKKKDPKKIPFDKTSPYPC